MDLNLIANGLTQSINPNVAAIARISAGYGTAEDGSRAPQYLPDQGVMLQKQALTQRDLNQLEKMNVQGADCTAYIEGAWYGVVRKDKKGGDLFIIGGETWLVVAVLEMWPDWSRVALCLQQ
ncbi:hypothetical protein Q0A17_04190 [Citrobacter sp. S2-9]|uniref:Uncharacterized protein n=1 Tax=Citrobacter enshiensis TaxID=2971264 RepID=A0ABT8PR84_9ENTR|nr:hypothetical protein [Citrobacter enshiensis]MDN8598622.1 hypothetical protein [Citrobacter enshiensis]